MSDQSFSGVKRPSPFTASTAFGRVWAQATHIVDFAYAFGFFLKK